MNRLDQVLQSHFPTVLVPRYEPLAALQETGDRFLLGARALKLEISRPWLHAVVALSAGDWERDLPYGDAPEDEFTLRCGVIPRGLIEAFEARAAASCPNEVGAWIVWSETTREFSMIELPTISHGPSHLNYDRPTLESNSWLIADLHSHGRGQAFFSSTDDRDDAGAVKLAMVAGRCDGAVQWCMRAELLGVRVRI